MVAGGWTRHPPRAALVDRTMARMATDDLVGWDHRPPRRRDDRAAGRTRPRDATRRRIGAIAPRAGGGFAPWRATRAASAVRSDRAGIHRRGRLAEAVEARSRT